jgi:Fe-S-cluster containining protein
MSPSASIVDLPVLESCDGCGACCFEQGAPPDYVALRLNPDFADDGTFAEDAVRLSQLPPEALVLLEDYLKATAVGRLASNGVCVWFDHATKGCRFYTWRPSTCRVFEINSGGCHVYRRRHAIEA